jgi:hypothetical protein
VFTRDINGYDMEFSYTYTFEIAWLFACLLDRCHCIFDS